ncbi:hypothetical protein AAGG52_06875 [Bacillus licheniformis]
MKSAHVKGVLMVLAGASLWGLSGSAAQYVFERERLTPARLSPSGFWHLESFSCYMFQ